MTPSAEELGLIESALQSVSGLVATIVILSVVVGVGGVVIWMLVTRSGKPQEDLAKGLVGEIGKALTPITRTSGRIQIQGENMRALSSRELDEGIEVRVIAVEGMIAKVVPANEPWPPPGANEQTAFGAPPDFDAVDGGDETSAGGE